MSDDVSAGMSPIIRTGMTAIVSALVGALFMVMMNSKATDVSMARNSSDIDDLKKRVLAVEQIGAQDHARIQALESKVDDIWKVVVLGEHVIARK